MNEESPIQAEQEERPFTPPGVQFLDQRSNRVMRLVTSGLYRGWIVYLHPDGGWVSLRMATDDDHQRIENAQKLALRGMNAEVSIG